MRFCFPRSRLPAVNCGLNILSGEFRNKPHTRVKLHSVLSSVMKFLSALRCPAWDVNPPRVPRHHEEHTPLSAVTEELSQSSARPWGCPRARVHVTRVAAQGDVTAPRRSPRLVATVPSHVTARRASTAQRDTFRERETPFSWLLLQHVVISVLFHYWLLFISHCA